MENTLLNITWHALLQCHEAFGQPVNFGCKSEREYMGRKGGGGDFNQYPHEWSTVGTGIVEKFAVVQLSTQATGCRKGLVRKII